MITNQKSNIPLDRLKAVSPELAAKIEDPFWSEVEEPDQLKVEMDYLTLKAIAANLLQLADEVNRQRTFIGKIANRISEPARRAREFLMPPMKRKTPASAGGRKE